VGKGLSALEIPVGATMQQGTRERPRWRSLPGSLPVSFRFYERSLDFFQVVVEGFAGAFILVFRFLVAVHEWLGRRFVW
jgi:hypothetical protein